MTYWNENKQLRRFVWVLVLTVAMASAIEHLVFYEIELQFRDMVAREASHLADGKEKSQTLGAMLSLGTLDPDIRAVATGALPPDHPSALGRLTRLMERMGFSNTFVQDRNGIIVAYAIKSGKSGTGRNLSFRPYFRSAMAGTPNMYAALGSNTGERGFYISAPVLTERPDPQGELQVVGVVTAKLDFSEIDKQLAQAGAMFAVASPEGVVFAANQPGVLFTVLGTPDEVAAIAKDDRVSKLFEDRVPQPLDMSKLSRANGRHGGLTMVSADIDWKDPEGTWKLLGFFDPEHSLGVPYRILIWLSTLGVVILGLSWRLARRRAIKKTEQVVSLLDNSGQGFLSFDANLIVDRQFSQACADMLGKPPARCHAAEVLFPDDAEKADLLVSTVPTVLQETDPDMREIMLSLLPSEIQRGELRLHVAYKVLANLHVMVILTDVSEERSMAEQLDNERQRLEFIVTAVTDSRGFFDTLDAFREFLDDSGPVHADTKADSVELARVLYREVHTYKGLLSQFGFQRTPSLLHEIEGQLSALMSSSSVAETPPNVNATLDRATLEASFEADLDVLRDALGEDFLRQGRDVVLREDQARKLVEVVAHLSAGKFIDTNVAEIRDLLHDISKLSKVSLHDVLNGFNGLVRQTAARMEKHLAPLEIVGAEDIWVDPERFKLFFRSLVHVFRNAVAHGIEDPYSREAAGKDGIGVIRCTAEASGGSVRLTIADDGGGIDVVALRQRIADERLRSHDELAAMPDDAVMMMVFADNVSTRAEVSELAGRGVGLAAVMAAITAIDGTASVASVPGQGTTFHFSWPLEGAEAQRADPAVVIASVMSRTRDHVLAELGVDVEAVEAHQGDPNQIELRETTAIIEMGAPVSLLMAFSFEDSLVTAFYDRMTAGMTIPAEEKDALRQSVIGEVVNIILGHCTADFSSAQDVSLTPPVVLQRRKSLRRMKDAVFVGRSLKTDYGCVDINLVGACTLFNGKIDYVE